MAKDRRTLRMRGSRGRDNCTQTEERKITRGKGRQGSDRLLKQGEVGEGKISKGH